MRMYAHCVRAYVWVGMKRSATHKPKIGESMDLFYYTIIKKYLFLFQIEANTFERNGLGMKVNPHTTI